MLGVTQIYSSRQAHEDRGGSTGYAGWATAYPVIWPSFFFSRTHRRSACQYIKKKEGETPGYTGFWREKPEKKTPHTYNILSQKVTQSELDASPSVGNDSLPDPIPSTAAPPHPLTKVNTSYPAPELPTVGNSLGHRQLAILGCRKGRLSSAGDLQVSVLPSSVAMRLKDAAT